MIVKTAILKHISRAVEFYKIGYKMWKVKRISFHIVYCFVRLVQSDRYLRDIDFFFF
jgi:hypothetical protein